MARPRSTAEQLGICLLSVVCALAFAYVLNIQSRPASPACTGSVPSSCAAAPVRTTAPARTRTSPSVGPLDTSPVYDAGTLDASSATLVAQVAGLPSTDPKARQVNNTAADYQVDAADLGIVWDDGAGHVLMAFGDTYGNGWTALPSGGPAPQDGAVADWRCNSLAVSSDHNLAQGMTIDSMIEDRPGHAGQILPCAKVPGSEISVIPTSGINVGSDQYLSFMSVRQWQNEWSWQTNYAGIAYSSDDGRTWTESAVSWPNNSGYTDPFQMLSFARYGAYVYCFGTPNGRGGNVYLARVPASQLLDQADYQYWTIAGWVQGAVTRAVPVAAGPAGEQSVEYDASVGHWLMVSYNQSSNAITLRSATAPTGPWSAGQEIVSGTDYPGLYGGYIHPWSSGDNLYFTMSLWGPYEVYLMHSTLSFKAGS